MGNRATVVFHNPTEKEISPAIYLHWNGGPESIYAFLDELDRRKVRPSTVDIHHEAARFVHIVGDFFDQEEDYPNWPGINSLSLGIGPAPKSISAKTRWPFGADDNGIYVVTRSTGGRAIRRFFAGREMTPDEVENERRKAYEHPYLSILSGGDKTIRKSFEKIRPKIAP